MTDENEKLDKNGMCDLDLVVTRKGKLFRVRRNRRKSRRRRRRKNWRIQLHSQVFIMFTTTLLHLRIFSRFRFFLFFFYLFLFANSVFRYCSWQAIKNIALVSCNLCICKKCISFGGTWTLSTSAIIIFECILKLKGVLAWLTAFILAFYSDFGSSLYFNNVIIVGML